MKTYTVLFAQDIPHYGSVEIKARSPRDVIAKAKHHWKLIQRGKRPCPCTDPAFDHAINSRIVIITDQKDQEIETDIDLDNGGDA
jgi:hypothetical protein